MQPGTMGPVRTSVTVARSREEAFDVFTNGFGTWWPYRTHSISEERVVDAVLEPRLGGRIYERNDDGSEAEWGRVVGWEPPRRLVFSWQPNPEAPGETEVEVTFDETHDGTLVSLEHRGWDAYAERATQIRPEYEQGWPLVLGRFAERAASA